MDVNEHERLLNFTIKQIKGTTLLLLFWNCCVNTYNSFCKRLVLTVTTQD